MSDIERPFDESMSAGLCLPENLLHQEGCYYTLAKKWHGVANRDQYEKWLAKQALSESVTVEAVPEMPVELSYIAPAVLHDEPLPKPRWAASKVREVYVGKFGLKEWNALPPPKHHSAAAILEVDFFYPQTKGKR